jgi:hypothetical protein
LEVASVAAVLPPAERAAFGMRIPEFSARVAPEPDAWIVTAFASRPSSVGVAVRERWVRSGTRVAVVRRGEVR